MASLSYCENLKSYNYNGMTYLMYVPEDVNSDTDFFVFVHGGKNMTNENRYNDWNSVIDYQLKEHGSDSIVIMPTMYGSDNEKARWNSEWASKTIDIVEQIQEEYSIQNNNVTSCGFSFGGWGAMRTTIENIKRNPNMEPQVLFMLDDYGRATQNPEKYILGDGGQEALLENNSIVFTYVNSGIPNAVEEGDKTRQLDTYAKSGMNLIRVVCERGGHSDIKNDFFRNGLVDYVNGKVSLPSDKYRYQVAKVNTDPSTGDALVTWEDINVEDIDTKEELYAYFNLCNKINGLDKLSKLRDISISDLAGGEYYLKSDALVLENHLNNIIGKIRSSSFLQGISSNFCSTSTVPSQIPSAVSEMFNVTSTALVSFLNDVNEFAKVAISIERLDEEMKQDADGL